MDKLEKYLMPIADKLGKNKILVAIRDGFLITTPLVIVASMFLLFANFPIPNWAEFWNGIFGTGWEAWFTNVSRAVFNLIGLFTVFGTSYAYGRELKGDAIQSSAIGIVSFIILTPTRITVEGLPDPIGAIGLEFLGSDGIFLAIIVSIISVWIFNWVYRKGWTIKMPDGVPPAVVKSFEALIPSAVVITLFFLVRIFIGFTAFETMHNLIFEILQTPLKGVGNTLTAQLVYGIASTVFWVFGINGPAVANAVFGPVTKVLTMENLDAFQSGQTLPNIFTDPFSNFFTNWGGGGSTLSLVIVMILFCKSQRIKQLGKLSLVPGIFGINEPIIFGLPIILNPIMAIPFIIVPQVNLILSTYATKLGIIPYTTGVALPWTTPIGFSGYLSTGSFVASIWQFALLALGCVIYYPFIKTLDKKYLLDEAQAVQSIDDEDISFDDISFDDL
ncbi:PTS sugar transporter subunit IIC [Vagococcus jeotgali]|uniref:PTS sugar transporter subunit IIC n=1 Tax=Vagococcus jeotgali TaxID=3109030 RepID=UPI002DD8DC3D|nr:PTS sugar transporter subunit IIC [Vagococcus sp. B2T-5]